MRATRSLVQRRPGVSYSVDDFFSDISQFAQSGSNVAGDMSRLWLSTGMSIEAIRNALNTIATTVGQDPYIVDAVADELRWLNMYNPGGYQPRENSWIVPALIGAGVIWLVMQSNDR